MEILRLDSLKMIDPLSKVAAHERQEVAQGSEFRHMFHVQVIVVELGTSFTAANIS